MGETISSIEDDYPNINFIEVDVDEVDDSVLTEYKIKNIPVLYFIKDGEIIDKNVGTMSKEVLVNKLVNVF
jgi:thioredoxin 1